MSTAEVKPTLSQQEQFLLDWLSKEDSSAYGECKGASLDALVERGLATVEQGLPGWRSDYARVSLTDAGYALRTPQP